MIIIIKIRNISGYETKENYDAIKLSLQELSWIQHAEPNIWEQAVIQWKLF